MINRTFLVVIILFIALNSIGQERLKYSANSKQGWYSMPSLTWTSTDIDRYKIEIVPIGFEFEFRGKKHSYIAVSPKGWVSFDTNVTYLDSVPKLSKARAKNLLAPMWDDHLHSHQLSDGKYATEYGSDTTFYFYWEDYIDGVNCAAPCNDFALALEKGTNKITFIYPPLWKSDPPSGLKAFIGIVGDTNSTKNQYLSIKHGATGLNIWDTTESSTTKFPQNQYYEIVPCKPILQTSYDTLGCDTFYTPSGNPVTSAGTYKDTLIAKNNCDSIITTYLFQSSKTLVKDTLIDSACSFYLLPSNRKATTSGIYTDTFSTKYGCDSIMDYILTILPLARDSLNLVGCDSLQSPSGKFLWKKSGIYIDTLLGASKNGCDSIILVNLTIGHPSIKRDTIQSCNSYYWARTGKSYKSTGVYSDTLRSSTGCDSISLLKLVIFNSSSSVHRIVACDSHKWINGITYLSSDSLAKDTLRNKWGCDSIVSLNLTINKSSKSVDSIVACYSYKWINGITYTSDNNSDTITLKNRNGCDSVVRLNLKLIKLDTSVGVSGMMLTSNEVTANYQWLDCEESYKVLKGDTLQLFTAPASGSYAVQIKKGICIDTSNCISLTALGLQENLIFKDVLIYPNPNIGSLTLELGDLREVQLKVYNSVGSLVFTKSKINSSSYEIGFPFPPGVYHLKISSNGLTKNLKVIKE